MKRAVSPGGSSVPRHPCAPSGPRRKPASPRPGHGATRRPRGRGGIDPARDGAGPRASPAPQQPRLRLSPPRTHRGCRTRISHRRGAAPGLGRNPQQPGHHPARAGPAEEAIAHYRQAASVRPGRGNLVQPRQRAGRPRPGSGNGSMLPPRHRAKAAIHQRARQLRPVADDAGALGGGRVRCGRPRACAPTKAPTWNNLGIALARTR